MPPRERSLAGFLKSNFDKALLDTSESVVFVRLHKQPLFEKRKLTVLWMRIDKFDASASAALLI